MIDDVLDIVKSNAKVVVLPSVDMSCFAKNPFTGFAPIYAIN